MNLIMTIHKQDEVLNWFKNSEYEFKYSRILSNNLLKH